MSEHELSACDRLQLESRRVAGAAVMSQLTRSLNIRPHDRALRLAAMPPAGRDQRTRARRTRWFLLARVGPAALGQVRVPFAAAGHGGHTTGTGAQMNRVFPYIHAGNLGRGGRPPGSEGDVDPGLTAAAPTADANPHRHDARWPA